MPHTVTPRFAARFIQGHHCLHFLSDQASVVGKWEEEAIDQPEATSPTIIEELEGTLLIGELDPRRKHYITIQHGEFTCEAGTLVSLVSHGYV
ncbi:type IV toxin-antitoxin system YeeU family antitoxin [Aeromonas salmonicida]|uniref:type IV toxin-antitoxin system YeeU family antitoxin n=1 Tax=Aeromonas salmonicida TaxID=645 RepID=UPI00259D6F81|nr:type IV toxin-antitoxin system YeeU family antitoxin [Aeromonas salmonicida]MDM5064986.1 type IV toxin-antitoxin system YeeU family antitoxin [Aeromonas salmonicida]